MLIKCLQDIYKESPIIDENNQVIGTQERLVKKDVITLLDCDPEDILLTKQVTNNKGIKYKNRCMVNHRTLGNIIVKHSFEEMTKLRNQYKQNFIIKGYVRK